MSGWIVTCRSNISANLALTSSGASYNSLVISHVQYSASFLNVAASRDGGEELLKTMEEYSGLAQASKALQIKVEGLSKQVAGLEEQAKLKGIRS